VQHRKQLDAELEAIGRDPGKVGILWDIILVVAETEDEAKRRREQILEAMPFEAAGSFISAHAGYDFSTLPRRFKLREVNEQIVATQASPVGFVHKMAIEVGEETEVTREEFFERALLASTAYDHTIAGTAKQIADYLEEEFEATGSRGGFMIAHPISTPRDLLNVVDFLVPELQRRGRFRTEYEGKTLMENLGAQ
jgi:alkanesulfonate monooxygenase SsuD/methylene tetrahydromethanopterin reductase-like flavin-dependent oxidoreductase (luciferase family)